MAQPEPKYQPDFVGVSKDNAAAIRAYEKVGFVFSRSAFLPNHPSLMVWDLVNQFDRPA